MRCRTSSPKLISAIALRRTADSGECHSLRHYDEAVIVRSSDAYVSFSMLSAVIEFNARSLAPVTHRRHNFRWTDNEGPGDVTDIRVKHHLRENARVYFHLIIGALIRE